MPYAVHSAPREFTRFGHDCYPNSAAEKPICDHPTCNGAFDTSDVVDRPLPHDKQWLGVDLDGTLAEYHGWVGHTHIGAPILGMVRLVQEQLAKGRDVRIFTARVTGLSYNQRLDAIDAIQDWCHRHIGQVLPVTNAKDLNMIELWDDRAVQVIAGAGLFADKQVSRVLGHDLR